MPSQKNGAIKSAHTDDDAVETPVAEGDENESTALIVYPDDDEQDEVIESAYPMLTGTPSQLIADIQDTLGEETLSPYSLDVLKVPAGGGKYFTVTDIDGEEKDVPYVDAVILGMHYIRSYWVKEFGGEATQPDCSSQDGRIGIGMYGYGSAENPMGLCNAANCPMARFGSAKNGKGQGCRLGANVFVMIPGHRFPVRLKLPTMSIGSAARPNKDSYRGYTRALLDRDLKLTGVVTRIGVKVMKSGVNTYSVATFALAPAEQQLTEAEQRRAQAFASVMRDWFIPESVSPEEAAGEVVDSETAAADAPAASNAF